MEKLGELFEKLADIFKRLRDPKGGCPWDLKQTHASLKPHLIEETYEVIDAIDLTPEKLPEELGDVLLQVMLHSQIGADEGTFTIAEVVQTLSHKLIVRHPHVFGEVEAKTAEEVVNNWEKIKREGRKLDESLLDGVPRSMPALQRSHRIGDKVARVGFDWDNASEIREKVKEELKEFLECPPEKGKEMEEEFGDLLFTLAQLARKLNLNAEELLQRGNDKFIRRFKSIEKKAGTEKANWTRENLEKLWIEVKQEETKRYTSRQ